MLQWEALYQLTELQNVVVCISCVFELSPRRCSRSWVRFGHQFLLNLFHKLITRNDNGWHTAFMYHLPGLSILSKGKGSQIRLAD